MDAEFDLIFHERLKLAMAARGFRQLYLAEAIGSDPSTVGFWCRGALPNGFYIPRICKALDISADWLLGLSDEGGVPPGPYPRIRTRRKTNDGSD